MKNIVSVSVMSVILILTIAGCSGEDVNILDQNKDEQIISENDNKKMDNDVSLIEMVPTKIDLSETESIALSANMKFNINFVKTILSMSSGENTIVSPLSASMLLSLLANTGDDEMRKEVCNVLGTNDIESLNSLSKRLLEELPYVDKSSRLAIANSLWYDKSLTLRSGVNTLFQDYYMADIYPVGLLMKDTDALNEINGWVSNKTNFLIPSILDEIPDNLFAILINTWYLKGSWQNPFDSKDTDETVFHGTRGNKLVDMMHSVEGLNTYVDSNFTAISKKMGTGNFEVIFLLPNGNNDLNETLQEIDLRVIYNTDKWKSYIVELSLPKIICKNSKQIKLNQALVDLGCSSLSDQIGILSNLFTQSLKAQNHIFQDAVISFDELGAEGAVVTFSVMFTSVGEVNEIKKIKLDFNRPYMFLIKESTTNSILFAGKVENV